MIVKKDFIRYRLFKNEKYYYLGWFLFGFIPIYVIRKKL